MITRLIEWLFKPNDWTPMWAVTGKWTISTSGQKNVYDRNVSHTILFSYSRQRFRLVSTGYDAKMHSTYPSAVLKLQELSKAINPL